MVILATTEEQREGALCSHDELFNVWPVPRSYKLDEFNPMPGGGGNWSVLFLEEINTGSWRVLWDSKKTVLARPRSNCKLDFQQFYGGFDLQDLSANVLSLWNLFLRLAGLRQLLHSEKTDNFKADNDI
jgi:hypothetical protein